MTPDEDGSYSIKQIVDWLSSQISTENVDSIAAKKERLELRKLENVVKNQDADLQVKAGNLIDREYVEEKFGRFADILKATGDQIGRKKDMTGKQAQSMFNAAAEKFIRELQGGLK